MKVKLCKILWLIAFMLSLCSCSYAENVVDVNVTNSDPIIEETGKADIDKEIDKGIFVEPSDKVDKDIYTEVDTVDDDTLDTEIATEPSIEPDKEITTEVNDEPNTGVINELDTEIDNEPDTTVDAEADTEQDIEANKPDTDTNTENNEPDIDTNVNDKLTYTFVSRTGDIDINDLENSGRELIVYGDLPADKMQELESILNNYNKGFSLAVYSLDGSKAVMYNGNLNHFSACTIKIPWTLYLCKGIDSGKYSKDDVLTYCDRHWYSGSGSIRWGRYGDKYTIEELITLCLSISDNVAYKMLMEYADTKDFNDFTRELGYQTFLPENRVMWSNKSIVKDYIGIWNDVYEYFKEDTVGSNILKKACTNTKWAWGVLTLPEGLNYSHKSGDNFMPNPARNDAGIVWSETPYVYAVFSKCDGQPNDIKVMNSVMSIIHEIFSENKDTE